MRRRKNIRPARWGPQERRRASQQHAATSLEADACASVGWPARYSSTRARRRRRDKHIYHSHSQHARGARTTALERARVVFVADRLLIRLYPAPYACYAAERDSPARDLLTT